MERYYNQFLEVEIRGRGEAELKMGLRTEEETGTYSHFAIRICSL
jgi:hypothetical protein